MLWFYSELVYSPIINRLGVLTCCWVIPLSFCVCYAGIEGGGVELGTQTCAWQFFLLVFAVLELEIHFCDELLHSLNLFTACFGSL